MDRCDSGLCPMSRLGTRNIEPSCSADGALVCVTGVSKCYCAILYWGNGGQQLT
jgi:hypothetical protein